QVAPVWQSESSPQKPFGIDGVGQLASARAARPKPRTRAAGNAWRVDITSLIGPSVMKELPGLWGLRFDEVQGEESGLRPDGIPEEPVAAWVHHHATDGVPEEPVA